MISGLLELMALKDEERAHSRIFNVEEPESVADHSWGVAFLCMIYAGRTEVDREKALKMAVIHDLAEAEMGDIANRADEENLEIDREEKARREKEIWNGIEDSLGPEVKDLWEEYSERKTPEAVFVKDMDLIDLALRALENEKHNRYEGAPDSSYSNLDEIFEALEDRMNTGLGEQLFREIKQRYEKAREQ